MDQETKKGITKELSTFFLWEKEQYIGYKSEEKDFRKKVTKIWCEVCARRKDEILNDPTLKRPKHIYQWNKQCYEASGKVFLICCC